MEPFESIYEQYFPRVYAFLYRMCRNENLAEELTQETFFQAFKSFPKYRGESELFMARLDREIHLLRLHP